MVLEVHGTSAQILTQNELQIHLDLSCTFLSSIEVPVEEYFINACNLVYYHILLAGLSSAKASQKYVAIYQITDLVKYYSRGTSILLT